jgi:hypothetical protein
VASPFLGWLSNLGSVLVVLVFPPSNYHSSVETTTRTNVSCMHVGFMHVAKEHLHCTLLCTFCSADSAHAWLELMDPDVSVLDISMHPNGR